MTVLYPNPCYKEVCYKGTASAIAADDDDETAVVNA